MKSLQTEHTSLGDRVFEAIRDAIIRKELVPGTLYSVSAISEQLGVSRTPVREALLQFAANGVIRFERNRGVVILPVTITDLEEIYKLRLLLEVPCAFNAAKVISTEQLEQLSDAIENMRQSADADAELSFSRYDLVFHHTILSVGGNDRIVEAIRVTRAQMHAKGLSTTATRTLQEIFRSHEALYDAIVQGDSAAAALAAQQHLLETLEILVTQAQDVSDTAPYSPPFGGWLKTVTSSLEALQEQTTSSH